jgi:hypothetical protein
LKLRATYGEIGNNRIGQDFAFLNAYFIGQNYVFGTTMLRVSIRVCLANPNFTWERARKWI